MNEFNETSEVGLRPAEAAFKETAGWTVPFQRLLRIWVIHGVLFLFRYYSLTQTLRSELLHVANLHVNDQVLFQLIS